MNFQGNVKKNLGDVSIDFSVSRCSFSKINSKKKNQKKKIVKFSEIFTDEFKETFWKNSQINKYRRIPEQISGAS